MEATEVFKWIKDLGLPVVALYYLFRLYVKSLEANVIREDKYSVILKLHSESDQLLAQKIDSMIEEIKAERQVTAKLLEQLVARALSK